MFGVIKGVQYCNQERLNEINNRISSRNVPSDPLQMNFDPRSVTTRRTVFPALDCHSPSQTPILIHKQYNTATQFNPGSSAPFSGYATRIDEESRVQNMFMPLQKWSAQTQFIPSSKSDLYNEPNVVSTNPVIQSHPMLFEEEQFAPFNPNPCNMGHDLLNNHTRQQVKNL